MNEQIEDIPVNEIAVPNPRTRNKIVFQTVIASISALGLKKPISVTRRQPAADGTQYDLIYGQGRLEAYKALGYPTIPALVVGAAPEERFLMGLVENIARRRPSNVELLREITSLKDRGYTVDQIAAKLDMHRSYVHGVVNLLEHGEERLIDHVEQGRIPISVAVTIANGTDAEVQQALCEAYENGALRGHKLTIARRIIAQRLTKNKKLDHARERTKRAKMSADGLVREYQRHIEKQRQLVRKAGVTNERILLMSTALRQLLADEGFVTVLRAERLETMPEVLAHRVAG